MSEWQPIETAPRDGTEILTYRSVGLMAVATWLDPWDAGSDWTVTDGAQLIGVTHWMPLPDPPTAPTTTV